MPKIGTVRESLRVAAPSLVTYVFDKLAPELIPTRGPATRRLINDPIWQVVELDQIDAAIVDLPLMQRLRFVRQLGLAHFVYPGAHHSRFEHSIGAMATARRMFAALAGTARIVGEERAGLERMVAIAALLHDCGHVAFSHAGERALADAYPDAFERAGKALDAEIRSALGGKVAGKSSHGAKPSEILSALFVLSPAFEALLTALGSGVRPDLIAEIAGLILGRAPATEIGDGLHLQIGAIVSGDLDADKLDYVARDSFYSGVSTFADVPRIVSQLEAVATSPEALGDRLRLPDGTRRPERVWLFGLRPAARSALEMLVASRAYLFDRIYHHHKVRCLEEILRRACVDRFSDGMALPDALDLLFHACGDDAVLARLHEHARSRVRAAMLVARDVPVRALAVSVKSAAVDGSRDAWRNLVLALEDRKAVRQLETDILAVDPGLDPLRLSVNVDRFVPIKENPDIWTRDADGAAREMQGIVNIEQHVTAFQNNRQVYWVFSASGERARAAAAAKIVLRRRYGLLVNEDGLHRSKTDPREVAAEVERLRGRVPAEWRPAADHVAMDADAPYWAIDETIRSKLPVAWTATSKDAFAASLARSINAARTPAGFAKDFAAAFAVMRALLAYAHANTTSLDIDALSSLKRPEDAFADSLRESLVRDERFGVEFALTEQPRQSGGYVDFRMDPKEDRHYPNVVVELKCEPASFESLADRHAGQPLQYVGDVSGRIAILFVCFNELQSRPLSDCVAFFSAPKKDDTRYAICIGVQRKGPPPSAKGRAAEKIGE